VLVPLLEFKSIDSEIENGFFDPKTCTFQTRSRFLLQAVVHDAGKLSVLLFGFGVFFSLVTSFLSARWRTWCDPASCILV
jgi:membrane-associated PAP2 superfamily phosphatase